MPFAPRSLKVEPVQYSDVLRSFKDGSVQYVTPEASFDSTEAARETNEKHARRQSEVSHVVNSVHRLGADWARQELWRLNALD